MHNCKKIVYVCVSFVRSCIFGQITNNYDIYPKLNLLSEIGLSNDKIRVHPFKIEIVTSLCCHSRRYVFSDTAFNVQ